MNSAFPRYFPQPRPVTTDKSSQQWKVCVCVCVFSAGMYRWSTNKLKTNSSFGTSIKVSTGEIETIPPADILPFGVFDVSVRIWWREVSYHVGPKCFVGAHSVLLSHRFWKKKKSKWINHVTIVNKGEPCRRCLDIIITSWIDLIFLWVGLLHWRMQ